VDELLLRVLATALGRYARIGSLEDLEQRLLHALSRDVPRDGEVFRLAGDLVDLVDVDDAHLGASHIEVGGRKKLEQDVLHVLAHVSGLGEGGGIGDGKGHLEEACERLGKERLACARGTEKQDVALGDLDLLLALGNLVVPTQDSPIVVVDRDAHRSLGRLLTHDILRELLVDFVRRGKVLDGRIILVLVVEVMCAIITFDLVDHVGAGVDAFVADVDATRALDELAHLTAGLAAEGAAHLLPVCFVGHAATPGCSARCEW